MPKRRGVDDVVSRVPVISVLLLETAMPEECSAAAVVSARLRP